jgi:hypothetical protein
VSELIGILLCLTEIKLNNLIRYTRNFGGETFSQDIIQKTEEMWRNNIKWFLKIDYGDKMWTKLAQIQIKRKVELFRFKIKINQV